MEHSELGGAGEYGHDKIDTHLRSTYHPPNPSWSGTSLTGTVTMTNANQFYDGPSVAVTDGTWLVQGNLQTQGVDNTFNRITVKLWDGTTDHASAEATTPALGVGLKAWQPFFLSAIVTGSGTYKLSAACTTGGVLIRPKCDHNGAGDTASALMAVRVG